MSQTIELPDPLFAEINDYAAAVAAAPVVVLRQAWDEFRLRHPDQQPRQKGSPEELKSIIKALSGSVSIPLDKSYDQLLEEALLEKHGPV